MCFFKLQRSKKGLLSHKWHWNLRFSLGAHTCVCKSPLSGNSSLSHNSHITDLRARSGDDDAQFGKGDQLAGGDRFGTDDAEESDGDNIGRGSGIASAFGVVEGGGCGGDKFSGLSMYSRSNFSSPMSYLRIAVSAEDESKHGRADLNVLCVMGEWKAAQSRDSFP